VEFIHCHTNGQGNFTLQRRYTSSFKTYNPFKNRCNEQDEDTVAVNYNEQNRLYALKEGEDILPTPVRVKSSK